MFDFAKLIQSDTVCLAFSEVTDVQLLSLKWLKISELLWIIRITVFPLQVDLSKAFGAISHSLLISKIKAYGFTENPVNLIRSFLCDRFQRVKIGNTYSDWKTIQHGVPQGSIFRPLLFNLFINDLTYSVDDAKLRLYADDMTLYLSHPNQDVLESRSQSKFDVLQSWFKCKYLNMNESKTNHWMTIRHTTNCLLTVLGHPWRWYTIWSY